MGTRGQPGTLADVVGRGQVTRGQGWQEAAACVSAEPKAFFPYKGGSTAGGRRICSGCPARLACLEWALDNGEGFGVWGGLTTPNRKKLQKALDAGDVEAARRLVRAGGPELPPARMAG